MLGGSLPYFARANIWGKLKNWNMVIDDRNRKIMELEGLESSLGLKLDSDRAPSCWALEDKVGVDQILVKNGIYPIRRHILMNQEISNLITMDVIPRTLLRQIRLLQ
jgi:hypothetical protein